VLVSSYKYIKANAQELDDQIIARHIDLYVNEFSDNLGKKGEKAVRLFLNSIEKAGIVPETNEPLFASD